MPVCERALGQVAIVNHGDHKLQYQWLLSDECEVMGAQGRPLVSIETAEGTVDAHDRTNCDLVFAPPKKLMLKNCTLTLKVNTNTHMPHDTTVFQQVVNGPTIPISLLGSGVEPRLVFSPGEIDFGMCFLHQAEMSPNKATVVMTNREKNDMRLVL